MKLKNQELLNLREVLVPFQNVHNVKIAWMVAQNLHKIEEHIKILQEMLKMPPALEAYEKERESLAVKHAKKDKVGNPMTYEDASQPSGRAYDIADLDAYARELDPIIAEHAQAQEDRKTLNQKKFDLLREDVDFEPYVLSVENTKIKSDSDDSVFDARTMLILLHCGILKE